LRALPKGHLHLHLEAALRPATLAELASERGAALAPVPGFADFAGFRLAYDAIVRLLRRPADVRRLVAEAVEDAAADGVRVLEMAVDPNGLPAFESAEGALRELVSYAAEAGAEHGVWTGIIVALDRTAGVEKANADARLAARFAGDGVVGLGLQSEERGYPASMFAESFAIARDAGLLLVPHAGELAGPESVWDTLRSVRPDRIQHGIRSVEDGSLVAELVRRDITLDVCPTSNVSLGVVESIEAHPLDALLRAGVRCTINADDPALFGPGILAEYELCRSVLGLTDRQLASCATDSILKSAAPSEVRDDAVSGIRDWETMSPREGLTS
jgi:adenosine deaminase